MRSMRLVVVAVGGLLLTGCAYFAAQEAARQAVADEHFTRIMQRAPATTQERKDAEFCRLISYSAVYGPGGNWAGFVGGIYMEAVPEAWVVDAADFRDCLVRRKGYQPAPRP